MKISIHTLIAYCLLFLLNISFLCYSIEDDVFCLKGDKSKLKDPRSKLATWTFGNTSPASICNLVGVTCWNEQETRLLSLQLNSFDLSGQIPESLKYCHSLQLQTLDLSNNVLSGSIPTDICNWLPYVVTLDLSNNKLSGSIPPGIADCKYLNNLILSDNKLSSSVPDEVTRLRRLRKFSVARNDLSGSIPSDLSRFPADSFEGNDNLCGKPLNKCTTESL